MAGDTITIGTYAWYTGAVKPPPTGASNLLGDLLNLLTGEVINSSHGLYNTTDNNPTTILSSDLGQFFTNKENTNYTTTRPKAFLNWMAFDNQLKMVSTNSGVVQVPSITGTAQAQPLVVPAQIIQKNGYIYIYVSNESAQNMFFDNLVVHHKSGSVLEETHYYPFGLTMSGISTTAPLKIENRFKFNGKELNCNEFNDGTGLEGYDYSMRMLDPQLGRWQGQDLLADKYRSYSPYNYAINNPVNNVDPNGMDVIDNGDRWTITGNDIYTYFGYLQTISTGLGSWDNLEQGLEFASQKNNGKGGPFESTLKEFTITSSFAGENDFDNWWSNLKTGVGLTVNWALGTGKQSYVFKNDPAENAFRNSRVINQARDFWYDKVNAGEKK